MVQAAVFSTPTLADFSQESVQGTSLLLAWITVSILHVEYMSLQLDSTSYKSSQVSVLTIVVNIHHRSQ